MSVKRPSQSLMIDFSLKSILLDIKIATPTCFLGPFDLGKLFPNFYSEVVSIFEVEVCFLIQQKPGSCLYPFS